MQQVSVEHPVAQHGDAAFEDLFESREQWLLAVNDETERLTRWHKTGSVSRNAVELLRELRQVDASIAGLARTSMYAGLRLTVLGKTAEALDDAAKVRALQPLLAQRQTMLEVRLARLTPLRWADLVEGAPELAIYSARHATCRAKREHYLSLPAESALAALDSTLQAGWPTYRRVKEGDLRFAPVTDAAGQVLPFTLTRYEKHFETSSDPVLRRQAWESFTDGVERHQHTFTALYNTELSKQLALAKHRRYSSVIDYLLSVQQIPRQVYETQLETLRTALPPVMRRFARIKQRWLNLPSLALHDLKANPDVADTPVTYAAASSHIRAAVKRFDPSYAALIDQAFDGRWIDYADRPGKPNNAGCGTTYGPHPYVTLSWGARPRDAFLLAHELGHLVHFHRAALAQPPGLAYSPRYFIEAPSTFNELLLGEHLLERSTGPARAAVLLELLHSYYHNFVTHFHEADFQDRVYALAEAGQALSAERLSAVKTQVLREFWGDTVHIDDRAGLLWTRQHHYYMGLYPGTYAAGQAVATQLLHRWRADPAVAGSWLAALDAGTARPPLELLAPLGIDPTQAQFHLDAIGHIDSLVQELDALVPSHHPWQSAMEHPLHQEV